MTIKSKKIKEFQEGRGYSKEDWDAIDSPPLTDEEISQMRPAREVMPDAFFAAMKEAKRERGRPKLAAPKLAVTLRLDPDILQAYKAKGRDWRSRMGADLRKAIGL